MKFLTICAGGGLADIGIKQAGHKTVVAIEKESWIANVYKLNFPDVQVVNDDCSLVDYSQFKGLGIEAIWASYPCQQYSIARDRKLPDREDKDLGLSLIDAVDAINPKCIFLENVPLWAKSKTYQAIRDYLFSEDYWVSENVLNAADYGVPQNRKRFIVRAVKKGFVASLPKLKPHGGWYKAIADLIPICPEIELTNWQQRLINIELKRPVLIPHVGARKSSFRLIESFEPSPTLRALGGNRDCRQFDFYDKGKTRQLTIECEMRLQTMPDNYIFGEIPNYKKKIIIGNGVPCLLVEKLLKCF